MKILVVDDHPTNRELFRAQLETEGFTVLEAADGLKALSLLERETIDTIISDLRMPRMDGYRFCLEVRKSERFRSIPFIVYTSTFSAPGDEKLALCASLSIDPKGKLIPSYLSQLAEHLSGEQASALKELAQLQTNVEHIKDIVSMQQNCASISGVAERITVMDLVEDALRMNAISLSRRDIQILKEFEEVPPVMTQKQKVLQILVNLIRNANQACDESGNTENRVTLRVAGSPNGVSISVSDNGVGISPQNLTRIFAHGFTTKKDGHGFGLHGAALAAKELGGLLTVRSDGVGQGATFVLELPLEQPSGNATPLTNQARPSA